MKLVINLLPTEEIEVYEDLPKALCFAIDASMDSVQQASRLSLLQVHMRRSLWLKHWEAEASCKKYLTAFPFGGEHLCGDDLNKYIQKITGGKSTLLPVKRKSKRPSFKRTLSPAPGNSVSRQWRRPPWSNTRGKAQSQAQGQKRTWGSKSKQNPKTSL